MFFTGRLTSSEKTLALYRNLRNVTKKYVTFGKRIYYLSNIEECKSSTSDTWNCVKSLKKTFEKIIKI